MTWPATTKLREMDAAGVFRYQHNCQALPGRSPHHEVIGARHTVCFCCVFLVALALLLFSFLET